MAQAANPPVAPHIIWWNGTIGAWAQGATWIKVLMVEDVVRAKDAGAYRVFYRPYQVPGTDNGQCNDGAAMANQVLSLLATIPQSKWPEAIGYRNEFTDLNPTPQQFIPYYDTLRAGGYTGMICYGSYSVGWPEQTDWALPQIVAACNKADGIQTHEYFDLTVTFQDTWLCRRHVRAINEYPYLLGKPWFIGEFGSGPAWCPMEDPQCRQGWNDRGKMSAQQYIDQMSLYRSTVADQVKAIFVFSDGDNGGWPGYPVCGTAAGDWMKNSTWTTSSGIISGTVKDGSNNPILGATVSTNTGGYTCTTNLVGRYDLVNLAPGTYNVTATKTGYNPVTNNSITATTTGISSSNFTLGNTATGTISGTVKDSNNVAISGATVQTNTGGYTATTNASGVYTLSNVTVGTYNVTASKTGYNPATNNNVSVTSGSTTTSNFTLSATSSTGSITGYVKDLTNVAISGATVSTNTGGYTTTTAADGTYTLSNVASGTYNVTASKTNYVSKTNNGVVVTTTAVTSNFNLQNTTNSNTPTGTNNAPQSTQWPTDTSYDSNYTGAKAIDGQNTAGSKWCTTGVAAPHWLALDLGQDRTVNGFIVRLPGGAGEYTTYNAKNFSIQSATSMSGPWSDEVVVDNTAQANTVARSYVSARTLRYVRLYITNSGIDNYSRIPEFEVWCGACSVPSISAQPQNSTVCAGTGASFSVTATGATSYQWKKASSNISGATNSSYSIASTVTGDAASYTVVVTNACGSVTSSAATLTVNTVPSITTQPSSLTRNVGESATFSLSATGATGYQWKNGGTNISGATNASYTIASVVTGDAGNYTCAVSNSCGSVTSSTATLTVNAGGPIASEAFTSMPTWSSTFDATWGSAATWSIVSGGQSGNCMTGARSSQGSSAKAKVYTVPASTNITVSVYLKSPSYSGGSYWVETSYKFGSNTAQDFDQNSATWTPIKNFSNTGTNGNGNVWTQYTTTVNTGSNTQISIGYKHGASGCVGPTMSWDTFAIN